MAIKKFEKGTTEWNFFSELWQLSQSIWVPENNDEYYEKSLAKIKEFDGKYNTPYSKHFSTALTKTLNDFSINAGFEEGKIYCEPRTTT